MKKEIHIPSYRIIWGKIRFYQSIHQLTDAQLASFLNVGVRTLKDYDKNAQTMSLGKLENFLTSTNMKIEDFIAL